MHKQSKRKRTARRLRYSNEQIMEALRSLEAEGRIHSKLCPDGKVRFFVADTVGAKRTGKRQAQLMI